MVKKSIVWLMLTGFGFFIFASCGHEHQNIKEKNAEPTGQVISEELHKAQCDLLSKANEELANINEKVRNLNTKIRENGEKGIKLTDEQNAALDELELKQALVNKRMHEIKNVKQEDWDTFKTTFEKDLDETKTVIDNLLSGFK